MIPLLLSGLLAGMSAAPARSAPTTLRSCYTVARGKRYFVGTGSCMRLLPRQTLSGYMTVDVEGACFARTIDAVEHSCETDLLARKGILPTSADGLSRLYRVRLRVAGDGRRGLYGRGGVYPMGYYVLAVRSAKLVER